MEKFEISVTKGKENHHFEVRDYMHHDGELCKYEVFENSQFIGSFEPNGHRGLHVCVDGGVVEEELLYLIAEQL